MPGSTQMDNLGDDLEELSFSEWPDPPGSHPWLPAYGYQPSQDHQLEKEDFLDPADAALFLGNSAICGSVTGLPPYLETIVEETSEELHSEDGSSHGWMGDSDTDSVIHVNKNKEECDSGSERDFLCPAKRRRPNQFRPDCPSPSDTTSFLSLSRSSSLAQFESLEQSCQLLEASAPPSPLSILSLDSLERLRVPEIYPDSLENSSDSERISSSSQESAYRVRLDTLEEDLANDNEHGQDRSLPEQGFIDKTYVVVSNNKNEHNGEINECSAYFQNNGDIRYWNANSEPENRESSSSEFSSGDSDKTVHEEPCSTEPLKFNFKSCRSLDAMSSIENLEGTKIENNSYAPSNKRQALNRQITAQYSVENLSEDSGYSDNFCNILRMKSKSISNVNEERHNSEKSSAKIINYSLKRKSEDNLPSIFNAKCLKKSDLEDQFGVGGRFNKKTRSPDVTVRVSSGVGKTPVTKINSLSTLVTRPVRPSLSLPDLRSRHTITEFDKYFNRKQARNTFPRSLADKLAKLLDEELVFDSSDANLYSVSSVPKDLNLCDVPENHTSFDDNWSFGTEKVGTSIAAQNFDLGDFNFSSPRSQKVVHEASFKQSFRVCESFTTSVADLTVLDYRSESDVLGRNVLKKKSSSSFRTAKSSKMSRNLPTTREMSVESNSTTESEKVFLYEMEQTMKQLSNQSKIILEKSLNQCNFDKNLSILTNQRLHTVINPFDEVIAELEKKQARSRSITEKNIKSPSPNLPPPEYEFNYYGEDPDPPYYRRHFEISHSNTENSNPDISDSFNSPFFHSTPMKSTERVQSTPNLNVFKKSDEDILYSKVTPQDELRSSMQHVPLKNEFKPVGILGSKSQGFSGSGSSKGVHFCPIVAEVSWRERSYSEDSNNDISSSSSYSSGYDPPPKLYANNIGTNVNIPNHHHHVDVYNGTKKVLELQSHHATATPQVAECRTTTSSNQQQKTAVGSQFGRKMTKQGAETQNSTRINGISCREFDGKSACVSRPTNTPIQPLQSESNIMDKNTNNPPQNTKQNRSKIGGFLSRFANFRFSTRKSSGNNKNKINDENNGVKTCKKSDGVSNNSSNKSVSVSGANTKNSTGVNAVLNSENNKNNLNLKNIENNNCKINKNNKTDGVHSENVNKKLYKGDKDNNYENATTNINNKNGENENFIYIPLKPTLGLPPLPPGRSPRSPNSNNPPAHPQYDQHTKNNDDLDCDNSIYQREYRKGGITTDFPVEEPGLLETDLDTETTRTVHLVGGRARSLLQIPPPAPVARSHKSMEYLLDKDNLKCVEPPENDLQKNSADRVLSEHQLRVQRSLQKLNLPDWYKNAPLPREGFLLKKRGSDASPSQGWAALSGLNGKTTSLGSLGGQSTGTNSLSTHQGVSKSPLSLAPQSSYSFTRWSTSRLNSAQTSPCSSARSSVRSGLSTPPSPLGGTRPSLRPARQPYLGWRSQERLATPRTPHERLAISLLPQSPPVSSNVSEEIQSSIKEVTNAIVHYVSTSNEPIGHSQEISSSSSVNRQGSPRLWLESSFVGTKPLESPQTPVVVQPSQVNTSQSTQQTNSSLGQQSQQPTNRPLQLDLHLSNGGGTIASTTYQHDWLSPEKNQLLNLAVSKPSPGSTTLEDVLDSLLGLPSSAPRAPSPQTSPRSPYMLLGLHSRHQDRRGSQCSSLHLSISSRTDAEYHTASRISGDESHDSSDTLHHSITLQESKTASPDHKSDYQRIDLVQSPETTIVRPLSRNHHLYRPISPDRSYQTFKAQPLDSPNNKPFSPERNRSSFRPSSPVKNHSPLRSYSPEIQTHNFSKQNQDKPHPFRAFSPDRILSHSKPQTPERSPYTTLSRNSCSPEKTYQTFKPSTPDRPFSTFRPQSPEKSRSPFRPLSPDKPQNSFRSQSPEKNQSSFRSQSPQRSQSSFRPQSPERTVSTFKPLTPDTSSNHIYTSQSPDRPHHNFRPYSPDRIHQTSRPHSRTGPQRLLDEENIGGSTTPMRRRSSGSSCSSAFGPGMDGVDNDDVSSLTSVTRSRSRAKSVTPKRSTSRRQSEPVTTPKSVSLDRRISYDPNMAENAKLSKTSTSDLRQSRTSLKSIASINTDASEETLVHCRYTKCTSATTQNEAKRNYKNCHNCSYMYCSRECRRAHWEKHRKVCLHSRASALCKQILSTAKECADSWHHISVIAQKGYLAHGRGVVKAFFTSPEAAEKFLSNGFQSLGEPIFVKWPDLMPNEMGPELYAELVKLCKSYNPETKLVLYVAVCIISEVPTKGAVVKWERQLVSRCAKIRLSKTVSGLIPHGQIPFHLSPKAKAKNKLNTEEREYRTEVMETLILTSNCANIHNRGSISAQKLREISFTNIQSQLSQRGVHLKKHFPEVYSKLCTYVEGSCDKFAPMTIYPRNNLTGKCFMCVIMPETEPDKFNTLPSDGVRCRTVDVSLSTIASNSNDGHDQLSTPM